ncbi:Na(+)/H(+) exchange regulatory cofactor NHE-RF2 isoform X3 [Girardinichthys multiradiatus]|uniref:Na(+)/H(+) exchange regulatory cofactor NHE-RF2 isoform X3 n=1 Tax=Girardinichthys multiradiatus TaxID=208333 RepID=UPI001FADBB70|nr:Na(+)/H(+) exchange regulatory cofactor NHE-RF2 isoform X3 [Girardinichthys multiradiatus]
MIMKVVKRICEVPHRTRLLVVDRETDDYLHSQGLACTEDQAIEMGTLSPRPSPRPTPSASPIPRGNSPLSPKSNLRHFFRNSPVHPPTYITTQDKDKRASMTSSSAIDTEVGHSPEPTVELLPRLCRLVKGENGYCFNLQNDKKKGGQFVRSVDHDSPAERAGLRTGDRLVEVNGVNTKGLRHSEVVALIRSKEDEVFLLVVDQETDELFHRLGITPTTAHIKGQTALELQHSTVQTTETMLNFVFIFTEVYVDGGRAESTPPTPSPTTELPATDAPVISITLTDPEIMNTSPKSRANGSSASHSSRSSTTQSEISSSDMSYQVPDDDDRRISDPFMESGLHLSPTAAEARQKVLATHNKKRAPPMDWSRKQELFSNF